MPFERQNGKTVTAVPMPYLGARWGRVTNTTLQQIYPRKSEPVPILQEVEWKSGSLGMGAENLAPTGTWSPNLPARSKSQYFLLYSSGLMLR